MTHLLRRTHPMVLIAAVAVTMFCMLASAVVTGVISGAHPDPEMDQVAATSSDQHSMSRQAKPEARTPDLAKCNDCGVIESITMQRQDGNSTGNGAVAGGVAGSIAGGQPTGQDNGRKLMTLVSVGGDAYTDNTIERTINGTITYQVTIRMADGSVRSLTQSSQPAFAVGDKVKLSDGGMSAA